MEGTPQVMRGGSPRPEEVHVDTVQPDLGRVFLRVLRPLLALLFLAVTAAGCGNSASSSSTDEPSNFVVFTLDAEQFSRAVAKMTPGVAESGTVVGRHGQRLLVGVTHGHCTHVSAVDAATPGEIVVTLKDEKLPEGHFCEASLDATGVSVGVADPGASVTVTVRKA